MKSLLPIVLAAALTTAHAENLSNVSEGSAMLSGLVVLGSVVAVGASGHTVVESVQDVGDGVELLLKNGSNASKATVRLSGKAARGLSVGAGTVLDVVATSTGHMLVLSGKVLAFIPNELGQALLHHSEVKQ